MADRRVTLTLTPEEREGRGKMAPEVRVCAICRAEFTLTSRAKIRCRALGWKLPQICRSCRHFRAEGDGA